MLVQKTRKQKLVNQMRLVDRKRNHPRVRWKNTGKKVLLRRRQRPADENLNVRLLRRGAVMKQVEPWDVIDDCMVVVVPARPIYGAGSGNPVAQGPEDRRRPDVSNKDTLDGRFGDDSPVPGPNQVVTWVEDHRPRRRHRSDRRNVTGRLDNGGRRIESHAH